ncbi:hypothetical protein N0V90_000632 [Kalmusia sp. IMI 367209]|nr:hypothetical protein N0V90_000632 [Kalmusia sp. IMI 367209]
MALLPFLLLQLWATVVSARTETPSRTPKCDASKFTAPVVPGAKVLSIIANERRHLDIPNPIPLFKDLFDLSFCNISIYLTHPGSNDKVLVQTWLPLTQDLWNHRFQATGGGGLATGMLDLALGPAVAAGYAASSTDGGHPVNYYDAAWLLNEDKSINWDLLHNFATRSLADQIIVGKSLTEQFYGQPARYAYWNGCSQGGRQGFAVAQRFPGLLNGVLAAAPALKFPALSIAGIWPAIVMKEADTLVSNCEFDWFTSKVLEECDILDGAKDRVIGDPGACTFDPRSLVGQELECSEHKIKVTEVMADIVRKVQEGPKGPSGVSLFPGLTYGTSHNVFVNVTIDSSGIRTLNDVGSLRIFAEGLLLGNSGFDITDLTTSEYFAYWVQAHEEFSWIIDADNSDLSAFRDAGAKLLSWHGTNDQTIPYQTTVKYRQRVERELGGIKAVDDFFRLFLAPGVEHCGLGSGAMPKDPLKALVDWVEMGEAPDTLAAETHNQEGDLVSRDLCRYPMTPKYLATGDANRASSWTCVGADEEEETLEAEGDFAGALNDPIVQVAL